MVAKTHQYFDEHQQQFKDGYTCFIFDSKHKYLQWLFQLPIQQRTCSEIMFEHKLRYEFYDIDLELMSNKVPEKIKNEILSQSNPAKYVFEKFSKIREQILHSNNITNKFLNNECYIHYRVT